MFRCRNRLVGAALGIACLAAAPSPDCRRYDPLPILPGGSAAAQGVRIRLSQAGVVAIARGRTRCTTQIDGSLDMYLARDGSQLLVRATEIAADDLYVIGTRRCRDVEPALHLAAVSDVPALLQRRRICLPRGSWRD